MSRSAHNIETMGNINADTAVKEGVRFTTLRPKTAAIGLAYVTANQVLLICGSTPAKKDLLGSNEPHKVWTKLLADAFGTAVASRVRRCALQGGFALAECSFINVQGQPPTAVMKALQLSLEETLQQLAGKDWTTLSMWYGYEILRGKAESSLLTAMNRKLAKPG